MVGVYVVKLWFSSLLANVIWCSCGLLMVQHMLTHCIMVSFCGSACVGRIVGDSSRLLMWRSCWRHEFIWSVHWLSCQWYVC